MKLKLLSIWKLIFAKGYYIYFTNNRERSAFKISAYDVELIKKDCIDLLEEQAQQTVNIEFVKTIV